MHTNFLEKHYTNRVGWLRASVLGANDGILSVTSIAIGVAAASSERNTIILAALAGLVSGAMSMAAGEYVSVSSQADTEKADLLREEKELKEMPEMELAELAKIYESRGVSMQTALQVAKELTNHNALEAHAKDELGINEITQAKPFTGSFSILCVFYSGGDFAFYSFYICSIKNNGLLSIYFVYRVFDVAGCSYCKNRRFKNHSCGSQNVLLGNNSNGCNSFSRTFIWDKKYLNKNEYR